MSKRNNNMNSPHLNEGRKGVITHIEELEFGLKGVVRILSRSKGKRGYFIQEFEALFASELDEDVKYEKTYIDHENLKIVIKLPNPANNDERERLRHEVLKNYTLGIDDLRTRAGLIILEGMDEQTKKMLIQKEKKISDSN